MEQLIEWDWNATLFLNDWGPQWLDSFFLFITEKYNSMPFYLFLLYMVWRYLGKRNTVILLLCVAALIAASDQLASVFKYGIERLRPFREPELQGVISIIGKQQGRFGFYSAHASSAFALATFIYFAFRKKTFLPIYVTAIWALIVTYSRVYIGVHYLGDLLVGALMGIVLGLFFSWLYSLLRARYGRSIGIR